MHKLGAKIVEIPFKFGLRNRGTSKMEKDNAIESLRVVLSIRFNENASFFKFAIVGVAGLIVDTSLFNIFRLYSGAGSSMAAIISGGIAMLTTFLLNNYWSFGDRKLDSGQKKLIGIIIYFVSSSVPILVRSKIVALFTNWFGDTFIISNIAFFIGIIFGLVWNFFVYSRIIWRKNTK
jgi:dolichol-phosphate mannosyltransferase